MPENPPPARAPGCEWIRASLLAANIAWTTACLGGAEPGSRAATAVLTALLVAAHFGDPRCAARAHPAGWLLVPFIAYAAANAAWVSPVGWLGWTDWLNWAQAAAVFWIVLNGIGSPACRRLLATALVAVGVASALLGAYQHFARPDWLMFGHTQAAQYIGRSSGPFGIPNSLGTLMALLIPPVGALALDRRRKPYLRLACALALASLAAGFVLAVSRAAWLSLAAAFALRPLLAPGRGFGRRIAGAAGAAAAAALAGALIYFVFPLMRERVDGLVRDMGEHSRPIMWRGALGIFAGHPLLGGGAGGFDTLFEGFRPEGFLDQPMYAHCDYLNTLCDYGAVGFLLLFGPGAFIAWRCARAAGLAGAAFVGLLAFALHLLVEFHLKIPALAMIGATIAAMVVQEAWPGRAAAGGGAPGGIARAASLVLAASFGVMTLAWVVPKCRAEALRYSARLVIDRMARSASDVSTRGAELSACAAAFARAVALDPSNAQAWADKAYAESLIALARPADTQSLGAQVERDADRAVSLCPVRAEFWIRKGTGLDMERRWIESGDCYVKAMQIAPMRADVWYYRAYHLSLNPTQLEDALAAVDVCLRLDPGLLLAQSLRQRLAIRLQQRS